MGKHTVYPDGQKMDFNDFVDFVEYDTKTELDAAVSGYGADEKNRLFMVKDKEDGTGDSAYYYWDGGELVHLASEDCVADAVWDELTSGHTTAGSFARALGKMGDSGALTYTHQDNTDEQTMLELTPTVTTTYKNTFFDFTNLTQDATLKVYNKIDGTNYIELVGLRASIGSDQRAGLVMKDITVASAIKWTLDSSIAEGATRAIDYRYFKQEY